MKKLFFAYSWILLTAGVILISAASIHFYTLKQQNNLISPSPDPLITSANSQSDLAFATGQVKGMESVMQTDDARAELVAKFLERYDSPLKPYDHFGQVFVELADQNNFDFRLLPAIAMQESNLCKVIPEGSYNCLGFGVHSRGTLAFESFEANFERAAKELKENYIDEGLTTPEQIMTKYTPSSDGSWAESVNQWMAEMKYNDRDKGRELKEDASVLEYAIASPEDQPKETPKTE